MDFVTRGGIAVIAEAASLHGSQLNEIAARTQFRRFLFKLHKILKKMSERNMKRAKNVVEMWIMQTQTQTNGSQIGMRK